MQKAVTLLAYSLLGISFTCWGVNPTINDEKPAHSAAPAIPSLPPPFQPVPKGSMTPNPTDNKSPVEPPKPELLQKQGWIENMQKELPVLLCKPEHYFIQCYKITPKECDAFTQVLVRACLNSVSIALPPQLSVEEGKHWGQMVGRCTYDLYEKFMQQKKKDTPNCKLPNAETLKHPEPQSTPSKDAQPEVPKVTKP